MSKEYLIDDYEGGMREIELHKKINSKYRKSTKTKKEKVRELLDKMIVYDTGGWVIVNLRRSGNSLVPNSLIRKYDMDDIKFIIEILLNDRIQFAVYEGDEFENMTYLSPKVKKIDHKYRDVIAEVVMTSPMQIGRHPRR